MSLFPFWRTTLGQVYNWLPERVYSGWCMGCADSVSQCVLSVSGGWHMTGPPVRTPHSTGRTPGLLRTLSGPGAGLDPGTAATRPSPSLTSRARALRSPKPCYNFTRAGPVIGKYCHPPLVIHYWKHTNKHHIRETIVLIVITSWKNFLLLWHINNSTQYDFVNVNFFNVIQQHKKLIQNV